MADDDFVRYLAGSLNVSSEQAHRVVIDVLDHFNEPLESYVRRRHAQCRLRGMRNEQIFSLIRHELANRLVAAPQLSLRQLRRMIYG